MHSSSPPSPPASNSVPSDCSGLPLNLSPMTPEDQAALRSAHNLLETTPITIEIANLVGQPLEAGLKKLPAALQRKIHHLVQEALYKAASVALWSLDNAPQKASSNWLHKAATMTSGALGGAFGWMALSIELPVTTTLMLRSIADIARSEGFDLQDMATRQECLTVFAFGGLSDRDDATDSAYYATRSFMTQATGVLSKELAVLVTKNQGAGMGGITSTQVGTWLTKVIEIVATRFGIVVSEKMVAQAVPVLGAVTGATINTLFMNFYQNVARGHFMIKRLEKQYGAEVVKLQYEALSKEKPTKTGLMRGQGEDTLPSKD